MVSESSLRAWSMCDGRRCDWRLAMNHAQSPARIKRTTAIVENKLWGSTALP